MAIFTLVDAYIEVGGTDLSDHVTSVTIDMSADEIETTSMGTDGWKSMVGGLKNWSVQIEFQQDFAASKVDATIWPLLGTNATIKVRPTSSAKSATNPEYTGSVLISQYQPVGNAVGELASTSVTWAGAGALSRDV